MLDFNERLVKEHYEEMYWEQGMSLPQIAKELGIPYGTLYDDFKRFRIPRRNLHESLRNYWKQQKKKSL